MKERDQMRAVGESAPGGNELTCGAGQSAFVSEGQGVDERQVSSGQGSSQILASSDEAEIEAEYPLTHGQKALWFLQRLNTEGGTNNLAYGTRIPHSLDLGAFERAVYRVVERHPVLRTTFPEVAGEPIQRVYSLPQPGHFTFIDATKISPAELKQALADAVFQRLDIENGPLHRSMLFKLAEDEYIYLPLMHHIVSDMWSIALFAHDLGELYAAERSGKDPDLKSLRATYGEHAREEAEILAGPRGEELWQFWRRELSGELPVLNLISDYRRPSIATYRGAAHSIRLGADLTVRLETLAKERGVDLMSLCLAVYQVLLHRYTGQDDILVATPKACRSRKMARVMGYFVNPVVVRGKPEGNLAFPEFLKQVAVSSRSALDHGEFPYSLLVERLNLPRDPSRTPLCQVVFAWQKTTRVAGEGINMFALNAEGGKMDFGEIVFESFRWEQRVSAYELALQMNQTDGQLGATFEYNTDLYAESTIRRMLEHLRSLFAAVVEDPDRAIGQLPMMTEAEKMLVLDDWNPVASGDEQAVAVIESIEEQAARTPEAIAVVGSQGSLTYAELVRRANRVASTLRRRGIGPGMVVGACLDRSPEAVAALLGVFQAGGIWMPIDPDYPEDRIGFMLDDANARVVLTQRRLLEISDLREERDIPIIYVDEIESSSGVEGDQFSFEPPSPDRIAYIIYTSGSTGLPKGVLITHGVLANHCRDARGHYGITARDVVLQFASFNFDPSLEQIFTALTCGARLVMREGEVMPPAEFNQWLVERGLTVINLPPAYWHQWLQEWTRNRADRASELGSLTNVSTLRLVIVGGDIVTPDSLSLWNRTPMKDARLLNAYGPTETTITATTFELTPAFDLGRTQWIPIGRPLPHRRAYILDGNQQPVPVGVPGELHLGGAGMARGYLNRPELTAEKFIPDPFSHEPGARLYRTGDLARFLPNGDIVFLGRRDHQVKIRGFRVELDEIEAVLRRMPGIRQAAILLDQSNGDEKRLVGFVALESETPADSGSLRRQLKTRLPDYMVPAGILVLDEMPLTVGGKIDRGALLARAAEISLEKREYVAPRTDLEREVAGIWAEVLKRDRVGLSVNFFDLGGHSLLATQLLARIRDAFGIELPLRDLFEAPTVEELAMRITQRRAEAADANELERLLADLETLPEEEVK